jgi:uncharacterized protein (TIGR02300 family)
MRSYGSENKKGNKIVSKPEWGTKRTCHHCDAFFYDMKKDPIICPKCLTEYDEKALLAKREQLTASVDDRDIPLDDEDALEKDEFFLDTPNDLMEALEDLDDEYDARQNARL